MIVKCVGRTGSDLPRELLAVGGYGNAETDFGVVPGSHYTVLAISIHSGQSGVYVLSSELTCVPAGLFVVADGRVSRHWVFNYDRYDMGRGRVGSLFLWGYPDFAMSDQHRQGLAEGRADAVAIFRSYEQQMIVEFARPDVRMTAKAAGDGFLLCAECGAAWRPMNAIDEISRCPECGTAQRVG